MKRGAIILLMAAVAVQGAVTSDHGFPAEFTEGTEATITYTKTIDGLTDGVQEGSVTPVITGPVGITLAAKPYSFQSINPESETLTWQWTPDAPGEYTIHFDDTATQGTEADITEVVTVEGISLPPLTWNPSIQTHEINGDLSGRNWGDWQPNPGGSLASNLLKFHNDGETDQEYKIRFLNDHFESRQGHQISIADNLRFLKTSGETPGNLVEFATGSEARFIVPAGETWWIQHEVIEAPDPMTTSQYTIPVYTARLR